MDFFSILTLGIVQGIAEWLPISSKTMLTVVFLQFLNGSASLVLPILLSAHVGTMVAAAAYFRKEIIELVKTLRFPSPSAAGLAEFSKSPHAFYLSALAATGIIAIPLLIAQKLFLTGLSMGWLLAIMGVGLILTAILLRTQKNAPKSRQAQSVSWLDGVAMGAMQGLSALPGISRSGCTTTAAVWRGFDAEAAFRLSFILSIPTVFAAEMLLWGYQIYTDPTTMSALSSFSPADALGLAAVSFIVGWLTIDVLLKVAKKIDFSLFVGVFGLIMLVSGWMSLG